MNLQTSFVPKHEAVSVAPAMGSTSGGSINKNLDRGFSFFNAVAFIVFGLSLVVYAGAFGYQYFLLDQINRPCDANADTGCGLRETLANDKRELQINQIIRYAKLDTKMKVADSLINSHRSVVPLLDALQNYTLQNVKFDKLDISDKGVVTVDGLAVGYDDLAVQQKALLGAQVTSGKSLFKQADFSSISLNDKGNVMFKLTLAPDPSLFSFNTFKQLMSNQTGSINSTNLNQ